VEARAALTWGRSDWGAIRPGEILREAGMDSYRLNLQADAYALWAGEWTVGEFIGNATDTVERAIIDAWQEGAARAGVAEDELTQEEQDARMQFMWQQWSALPGLADFIQANSRANEGKLTTVQNRLELWYNQYNAAATQAQMMAKGDQKLLWRLGATEEHCPDCAKYAGRVYRASTWAKYDIRPQHQSLACHGFRCLCMLEPTDQPANKGRPPALPG